MSKAFAVGDYALEDLKQDVSEGWLVKNNRIYKTYSSTDYLTKGSFYMENQIQFNFLALHLRARSTKADLTSLIPNAAR